MGKHRPADRGYECSGHRGKVKDQSTPAKSGRTGLEIRNVGAMEREPADDAAAFSISGRRWQVVDDHDLVAVSQQAINQVTADKTPPPVTRHRAEGVIVLVRLYSAGR